MGDTSSGKSSLLSAISGIEFPSSDLLTTRCPTQLILTKATTFSGSVRLVRFVADGSLSEKAKALESADDIASEIQALTLQIQEEGQQISDDAIVITVSGPQFPNLTLTDLPGIIRTVGDGEDKTMIKRVRELVERYLVQERTVILAVVPANVDMHNSEILQAAENADPSGDRTIAIITKPDLIDAGAEQAVLDLLHNRKKKLKYGYHTVKCRGQKDLKAGKSIKEGLQAEQKFFGTHEVWKEVDRKYVGIPRLTAKLVGILKKIISSSLPVVMKEIDARWRDCARNLTKLGAAVDSNSERRAFYSKFTESVNQLFSNAAKGYYSSSSFFIHPEGGADETDNRARAILRKHDSAFYELIRSTRVQEKFKPSTNVVVGDYVEGLVEGRWMTGKVTQISGDSVIMHPHLQAWLSKEKIAENRGDELPIFPSYNLFCSLVQTYICDWRGPMLKLLEDYNGVLSVVFQRAVDHSMGSSKFSKLHEQTSNIVAEALRTSAEKASTSLANMLEEEFRPYTLNHYLFANLIKLRNEPLIHSLEAMCSNKSREVNLDAVLAVMQTHGVGTDSNEDCEAKELQIALKAYLKVAKKRFADAVPMHLEQVVVQKAISIVKQQLSAISDEKLEALLEESQESRSIRADLVEELASLKAARLEIAELR
ncbi:P-loop containing nucleoside triphosphate hydrolase protein [Chytriomyces cf. hyalinus JEL632]|nr:P-loop containing nucleoside triphosphate hydrolase protein [Chytriomyces cf. hyalinus JEL632]